MSRLSVSFLAVVLALLTQTGCGKKEARTSVSVPPPVAQPKSPAAEAAPDAPPPPPSADPAAAPAAAAAPEAVTDQDVISRVVGALQSFYSVNNRGAKSLEELINGGFLKPLPQIPGKKLVLNPGASDPKDLVKIVPE